MSFPDYPVLILWAFLVLTVPFSWLMAAFLAAAFHEVCHLGCIFLVNGKFLRFHLISGGAVIDAAFSSPTAELLSALAGPVGSFLLVFLRPWFPRFALCALIQGLFNLMPVYPLDGGRAVCCLLRMFCPGWEEPILCHLENGFLWILALISLFFWIFFSSGILFVVLVMVLLRKRKRPCKEQKIRVQ